MKRYPNRTDHGQSMVEFSLVAPVLLMLFFGLTLAAFYAFRAASADWGVFISGVAVGMYESPADQAALVSVTWPDIASGIHTTFLGSELRQVRSSAQIQSSRAWVYGINLRESHVGSTFFRLWRFYPGLPEGTIE